MLKARYGWHCAECWEGYRGLSTSCKAPQLSVLQDLGELDGVCTFCEMAVPLVSRITEALGLPGNAPDAVDAARDKHSTRAKMQAAGLPTPRNMLVQKPSDLQEAADKVKFPAGDALHAMPAAMISSLQGRRLRCYCWSHMGCRGSALVKT